MFAIMVSKANYLSSPVVLKTVQFDIGAKTDILSCGICSISGAVYPCCLCLETDPPTLSAADKPLIRAVMEQIVINGHGINDDPQVNKCTAMSLCNTMIYFFFFFCCRVFTVNRI